MRISFNVISVCFVVALLLVGCKDKPKQESQLTEFELALDNNDSIEAVHVINQFFEYAESGNVADAAGMLYKVNRADVWDTPEQLDNDEMKTIRDMLTSLPVKSHNIDYIKFNQAYDNEAKCTAVIEPADGDFPGVTTVYYFRLYNNKGKWLLCMKDTNSGDRGMVKADEKDSLQKKFGKDKKMLEKK